jgi:hypothetical protein
MRVTMVMEVVIAIASNGRDHAHIFIMNRSSQILLRVLAIVWVIMDGSSVPKAPHVYVRLVVVQ